MTYKVHHSSAIAGAGEQITNTILYNFTHITTFFSSGKYLKGPFKVLPVIPMDSLGGDILIEAVSA
jgi:hypothetical protein